jgi:hypothetical protein
VENHNLLGEFEDNLLHPSHMCIAGRSNNLCVATVDERVLHHPEAKVVLVVVVVAVPL